MFDVAPLVFLVFAGVIALAFVAIPVVVIARLLRERARRRTWTPVTARLLRVSQATRGSTDGRYSSLVGHYEYRDQMGVVHQDRGDLGTQGMPVGEAEPTIDVLVDPDDPTRSQVAGGAERGAAGCVVIGFVLFGIIGLIVLTMVVAALLSTGSLVD